MTKGFVNEYGVPMAEVTVSGIRREITLAAMVDSGFDGFLCLPIEVAVGLGLELVTTIPVELADGTVNENELVFAGEARIGKSKKRVDIFLTGSDESLLGRSWFKKGFVSMDFASGEVILEEGSNSE